MHCNLTLICQKILYTFYEIMQFQVHWLLATNIFRQSFFILPNVARCWKKKIFDHGWFVQPCVMYVQYMFYNNVFVCCSLVLPFNSSQQGGARLVVKRDDDAGGRQVRVKEHGGTSVETANETLTFYRRRCADYVRTILKELSLKKINSLII